MTCMTTIDTHGNKHRGAGTPGGGQFDGHVRSAPSAADALVEQDEAPQEIVIGHGAERISVSQARRELPPGTRVQVDYLNRTGEPYGTTVPERTVASQSPHQMVTETADGERVHLDWRGTTAQRDDAGTVIVSNHMGVPMVAFRPLDGDEEASSPAAVSLHILDDFREARSTSDPDRLDYLAGSATEGVRLAALKNPLTTGAGLDRASMYRDNYERTQEALLRHQNVEAEQLHRLADSEYGGIRAAVAAHERTDTHTLRALARDEDASVRSRVAGNEHTPTAVLDELATDRDSDVRQSVASNPRTSVEMLYRLSHSDGFTKAQVAKNTSATPEILTRLAADTSTGNQTAAMVAANPAAPREIVNRSAREGDSWVREHAARNRNLGAEETRLLARDSEHRVRRALAANTLDDQTLGTLARDRDHFIRSSVAKNPATSSPQLSAMANDEAVPVRAAVAGNPRTPRRVLEHLANDDAQAVRIWAEQTLGGTTP